MAKLALRQLRLNFMEALPLTLFWLCYAFLQKAERRPGVIPDLNGRKQKEETLQAPAASVSMLPTWIIMEHRE